MEKFLTYNTLISLQNEVDPIKRTESELTFNYIIYNDWYLIPSVIYLSNTEQSLNYRWNIQLGIGNYIIRSNEAYWGIKLGINNNIEDYLDDTQHNQSWEGFIGTEADLFDTGDLKLFSTITAYPGISEYGRWRLDGALRFKYDLPLDLYIKWDFSLNYDNMPREADKDLDYVTTFGFGWEW